MLWAIAKRIPSFTLLKNLSRWQIVQNIIRCMRNIYVNGFNTLNFVCFIVSLKLSGHGCNLFLLIVDFFLLKNRILRVVRLRLNKENQKKSCIHSFYKLYHFKHQTNKYIKIYALSLSFSRHAHTCIHSFSNT